MQGQLPILIFAQSARFIAESATHAGYTVWVADCFGDSDTRTIAQRFQLLPPLSELDATQILTVLIQLSRNQDCHLICGTGIEKFYPILKRLPSNISLLGNSFDTIKRLRSHQLFFPLLAKLGLNHPMLYPSPSENTLTKNLKSSGGSGINQATSDPDDFYQQKIGGLSASVCFIANGKETKILTVNQQLCRPGSYQLERIVSPLPLDPDQLNTLQFALDSVTTNTALVGLNSLDFIIDDSDTIQILEVNPRISASAELAADNKTIFSRHVEACRGVLPSDIASDSLFRQLSYLFSETTIQIPAMISWPESCHDLPAAGTIISAGAPICTIIVKADNRQRCRQQYETDLKQINHNLNYPA